MVSTFLVSAFYVEDMAMGNAYEESYISRLVKSNKIRILIKFSRLI